MRNKKQKKKPKTSTNSKTVNLKYLAKDLSLAKNIKGSMFLKNE